MLSRPCLLTLASAQTNDKPCCCCRTDLNYGSMFLAYQLLFLCFLVFLLLLLSSVTSCASSHMYTLYCLVIYTTYWPNWSFSQITRINCYSDITEHLPHMKTLVHR